MSKTFEEKKKEVLDAFEKFKKAGEEWAYGSKRHKCNLNASCECWKEGMDQGTSEGYREGIKACIEMLRKEERESYYDAADFLEEQFKDET